MSNFDPELTQAMGGDLVQSGSGLPAGALWPAVAVLTVVIALVCRKQRSLLAAFVIFAVWLRFMLSAMHEITYGVAAAGLSWNALASIAVFGLGLLLIDTRLLLHRAMIPVYLVAFLLLVSGLLNGTLGGSVSALVKYGYFSVLMLGLYQVLRQEQQRGEQGRFLGWLLAAFTPLLLFQLLSVVLGVGKASEQDGSVSFIGGFYHEAAFSLSLAAGFVTVALAPRLSALVRQILLAVLLAGIFLANYRTVMLALAPLALVTFVQTGSETFRRDQRLPIIYFSAGLALAVVVLLGFALQERLADLAVFGDEGFELIRDPNSFSAEDRRVLSGRPYIWSYYILAAEAGSPLQQLLGFGPESWVGRFRVYAHNTLVAYRYELGWVGVGAVLLLWAGMMRQAAGCDRSVRARLLAAHLTFFLVNMATMPFWLIEGLIIYAVLCGYTLHARRQAREARRLRSAGFGPSRAVRRPIRSAPGVPQAG